MTAPDAAKGFRWARFSLVSPPHRLTPLQQLALSAPGGFVCRCPASPRRALLAALALSQPARAQEPTLRGPWLGAGIGTASAAVNCDICTGDRNGGLSGYLAGGFTVHPEPARRRRARAAGSTTPTTCASA